MRFGCCDKFLPTLAAALVLTTLASTAQAHGPYRGHVYYGGGWRDPWLAPLVVGATVGTAVYLSRSYPTPVVVTPPPVVYVNPPIYNAVTYSPYDPYASYTTTTTVSAPVPVAEAYYCREAGQYYPAVQTCASPWMLVRTP